MVRFFNALLSLLAVGTTSCVCASRDTLRDIVRINDNVALEVVSEDVFRVVRCGGECDVYRLANDRSSLVVLDDARVAGTNYSYQVEGGFVVVLTDRLEAVASSDDGRIKFYQRIGNGRSLLLKEDSVAVNNAERTVLQEFLLQSLPSEEAIYGGGQFINGFLNYRSAPINMRQFNTEAIVPFVVSTRNYGILWDLYGETMMNEPQEEIHLDEMFEGVFTPRNHGAHWFYLVGCYDGHWGCGGETSLTIVDPADAAVVMKCDYSMVDVPHSMACRVELVEGRAYTVRMDGTHDDRKLFVTSVETHNKLTFKTRAVDYVDYYFMVAGADDRTGGGAIDRVIGNYRKLTGTANMYAKWAYGFWQCKERYHNQTELVSAAAEMRRRKIPVDAFVQDWHYWGDLGWGPQWDYTLYPAPQRMIEDLHSANIRFMVSTWSRFDENTRFYREMKRAGLIINGSTYMDAWNPDAQDLFFRYADEAHFSIGADALWLDATEPEWNIEYGQEIYLGSGDEYANTYSLMVAKTVHDRLLKKYTNRRIFSLTRSSFAGQQRYGAALWSGDTTGTWDELGRQIAMSINYQLSGVPYWSMDIGGFFRPQNQYTDPDYHHLLVRWFQFAVFTPIFRVHGNGSNTELWNYGRAIQDTIVDSAIRFRYRLLEYIYSGFWKVQVEHYTMQRGLALDFGDVDAKNVMDIADEFMFGPLFLVAPIYQPTSSRTVYVPRLEAGKWRNFFSGNEIEGGQSLEFVNMTISQFPLFVRSGILVLGPDGRQNVNHLPMGRLEIRVYDGCDSSFELFEDDGVSGDPLRPTKVVPISWDERSQTLTVGATIGDNLKTASRTIDVVKVRPGVGVGINPVAVPDVTFIYDGSSVTIHLPESNGNTYKN